MEKFGIQSSILTNLYMARYNLISKESVKKTYDGKFKNGIGCWDYREHIQSMNNDMERWLSDFQNGNFKKDEENSDFYYTPKLTNEELMLVEEGNKKHMMSYLKYYDGRNADVETEEMKRSNSKSKYVLCFGKRYTSFLTVEKSRDSLYDTIYTMQVNGRCYQKR